MDLKEAMQVRHSVRAYKEQALDEAAAEQLEALIKECNEKAGLNIQLVKNEPKAFSGILAHYGKFSGVTSYLALVGKKDTTTEEKLGYYGEKIVLTAQTLGINSCWVALTFTKVPSAFKVASGEKLHMVIALGYGTTQGTTHHSKTAEKVSNINPQSPSWFKDGVEAALLAPTAVNQQKFFFTLNSDGSVSAKAGIGPESRIDLGIAKFHFELGAGSQNVQWA